MLTIFLLLGVQCVFNSQAGEATPFKLISAGFYMLGKNSTWGTETKNDLILTELVTDPKTHERFPRKKLRVFRNGKEKGPFKVQGVKDYGCNSKVAYGTAESIPQLNRWEATAVTDSASIQSHPDWSVALQDKQKEEIKKRTIAELHSKQIEPKLIQKLDFNSTFGFRIRDGGELFASLGASAGEPPAQTLALAFLFRWSEKEKKWVIAYDRADTGINYDTAAVHESFLDRFDFDGDGQDEIVNSVQGYEGENYQILRYVGESWKVALRTEASGY